MGRSSLIIVLLIGMAWLLSGATNTVTTQTCSGTNKVIGYNADGTPICAQDETGLTSLQAGRNYWVATNGTDPVYCAGDSNTRCGADTQGGEVASCSGLSTSSWCDESTNLCADGVTSCNIDADCEVCVRHCTPGVDCCTIDKPCDKPSTAKALLPDSTNERWTIRMSTGVYNEYRSLDHSRQCDDGTGTRCEGQCSVSTNIGCWVDNDCPPGETCTTTDHLGVCGGASCVSRHHIGYVGGSSFFADDTGAAGTVIRCLNADTGLCLDFTRTIGVTCIGIQFENWTAGSLGTVGTTGPSYANGMGQSCGAVDLVSSFRRDRGNPVHMEGGWTNNFWEWYAWNFGSQYDEATVYWETGGGVHPGTCSDNGAACYPATLSGLGGNLQACSNPGTATCNAVSPACGPTSCWNFGICGDFSNKSNSANGSYCDDDSDCNGGTCFMSYNGGGDVPGGEARLQGRNGLYYANVPGHPGQDFNSKLKNSRLMFFERTALNDNGVCYSSTTPLWDYPGDLQPSDGSSVWVKSCSLSSGVCSGGTCSEGYCTTSGGSVLSPFSTCSSDADCGGTNICKKGTSCVTDSDCMDFICSDATGGSYDKCDTSSRMTFDARIVFTGACDGSDVDPFPDKPYRRCKVDADCPSGGTCKDITGNAWNESALAKNYWRLQNILFETTEGAENTYSITAEDSIIYIDNVNYDADRKRILGSGDILAANTFGQSLPSVLFTGVGEDPTVVGQLHYRTDLDNLQLGIDKGSGIVVRNIPKTWKDCVYIEDPNHYADNLQGADNSYDGGVRFWPNDSLAGAEKEGIPIVDQISAWIQDVSSSETVNFNIEVFDGLFGNYKIDLLSSPCLVDTTSRKDCVTGSLNSYTPAAGDFFKVRVTDTDPTGTGLQICIYGHWE